MDFAGRHLDQVLYLTSRLRAALAPRRRFWEALHALDDQHKRRFLFFLTGCPRAPAAGLGHLSPPMVIGRTAEVDRLPTAHTCFNHLLLPGYSSREALQRCLGLALVHAEGFGIV